MTLSRHFIHVFIIYAHSNRKAALALYKRFVKDGVQVWLDATELLPGQNWKIEIRKAILKSDMVIVCLSRQFNKRRGYRHKELKIAFEKATLLQNDEIFIVPVRLEKCVMPKSLRGLHRVDLFEVAGYKKLMRVLQVRGAEG